MSFAPQIWLTLGLLALLLLLLPAAYLWLALTEYSYLGSRFVRLSYDLLARWYEGKWRRPAYASQTMQALFLDPLLDAAGDDPRARVLDLACGTGRISLALLACPRFHGRLTAVDFSAGMLTQFRRHLAELATPDDAGRIDIVQQNLNQWRCEQPAAYDAATLLEAAELIAGFPRLVGEISSALKPGGVFLTTRVGSRYLWLFRGRHQAGDSLTRLLVDHGFERIEVHAWRPRYDVVVAHKRAAS